MNCLDGRAVLNRRLLPAVPIVGCAGTFTVVQEFMMKHVLMVAFSLGMALAIPGQAAPYSHAIRLKPRTAIAFMALS